MEEINEQDDNVTKVDMSKFESAEDDNIIKVDLSKPPVSEEEKVEEEVTEEATVEEVEAVEEVKEEVVEEQPALEEITEEEVTEEVVAENQVDLEDSIAEAEATGTPLPENIQKVVDFMDETGGTLEDYVNLNKDYSEFDNLSALTEYYKRTKPHLSVDEIDFLIEDQFDFDEDVDDEKDIKRKKLALKEQVASAKAYLDGQKSKYYDEVKAGCKAYG